MNNQKIKNAGLKVTLPRLKILEIMEKNNKHLSAEDVYRILMKSGEDIGLGTIYRVLTQFETAGLVLRHNFEGGQAVFELERGVHHDHLVCIKCGKVEEFMDDTIEKCQNKVAQKHHFKIKDHSLVIYGICNNGDCKGIEDE